MSVLWNDVLPSYDGPQIERPPILRERGLRVFKSARIGVSRIEDVPDRQTQIVWLDDLLRLQGCRSG